MRYILIFILTIGLAIAGPFEDHPYFKAITGNWVGEGELVSKDGTTIQTREIWEGKLNEHGSYSISGDRVMGDNNQEFTWNFTHNPATDLYECHYTHTGMDNPIRLTVTVSDEKIVLSAPFGDSAELTIRKVLVDKTIEGNVLIKDASGIDALKGKVIHKRSQ